MDYLGSGIDNLSMSSKSNPDMIGTRMVSLEHRTRIEHRDACPEIPSDPIDMSSLFDNRPLGIEIVGIVTPILNARVPEVRVLADENLDTSGVERGTVVLGSTAPLNIMGIRPVFYDDNGVLELSSIPHIHAEIRLEWLVKLDSLRNVQKCPPIPKSCVERHKLMIRHTDDPTKIFPNHLGMLGECRVHIGEYHAHFLVFFFGRVIDGLGVELCPDTRKRFPFCFGYPELIECLFYFIRDIIPAPCI